MSSRARFVGNVTRAWTVGAAEDYRKDASQRVPSQYCPWYPPHRRQSGDGVWRAILCRCASHRAPPPGPRDHRLPYPAALGPLVSQRLQTTSFGGDDMSDGDRATQAEQLLARMKAARGYIYPEWELAARTDPDFTDAYNRLYELALGDGATSRPRCANSWPSPSWRSGARTMRVWWPTCDGPYASAPPRRNRLTSLKPRWCPVEPPRSTAD
jgi:hypothetical protein